MSHTAPLLPKRGLQGLVLWPIALAWRLATLIVNVVGIVVGLVLGMALMGVGILLCSTVVGALVGFPVAAIGLLLFLRALY